MVFFTSFQRIPPGKVGGSGGYGLKIVPNSHGVDPHGFFPGIFLLGSQRNPYGYGSIPINTIFSGMNIHLPAILMFTTGTRF